MNILFFKDFYAVSSAAGVVSVDSASFSFNLAIFSAETGTGSVSPTSAGFAFGCGFLVFLSGHSGGGLSCMSIFGVTIFMFTIGISIFVFLLPFYLELNTPNPQPIELHT